MTITAMYYLGRQKKLTLVLAHLSERTDNLLSINSLIQSNFSDELVRMIKQTNNDS